MALEGPLGHAAQYENLLAEIRRRPAHGYLFAGPVGVGKSIVAIALIHSLFCELTPGPGFCCTVTDCPVRNGAGVTESGRGGGPAIPRCDCCAGCVQLAAGVHPDFLGVARETGRSDVTIEQVRNLIARLGSRPTRAPIRAALIDDADTLNLPAQNALLKTIEEPPGSTIIFLIARSERMLLDTVRSRLRLVRFGPLSITDLETLLARRPGLDAERIDAIARLARGSAGRAMSLADGVEPPITALLEAIGRARSLDFAAAQALAQEHFAARDQSVENFELIARMLEEMLWLRLLDRELDSPAGPIAGKMKQIAEGLEIGAILSAMENAVKASGAVDAMANSRLQAERWWLDLARAARGDL